MIPLSILDLAPIPLGSDATQALRNTLDLAQHAERWGYYPSGGVGLILIILLILLLMGKL